MTPYDEEFTRLKAGDETRKMAKSLYVQASELTKPASGRRLGPGQSALAAVCAFLASKRLGNGEVTRDQACAVACVDPKTFDATLTTVEDVLQSSRSPPRLNQRNITYRSLLEQFVDREDAYVPMLEVEAMLKACGGLMDGRQIELESSLMICTIFYWVCTTVLKIAVPDKDLQQMLKVSPKRWSASLRVLDKHCYHMTEDLVRNAETALSAKTARAEIRTGSKDKVPASLSASVLHSAKLSIPSTPSKSSPIHNMKRKLPADSQSKENRSPSKRTKEFVVHEEESENEELNGTIIVRSTSRKPMNCSPWDRQKPIRTTVGGIPLTPSSTIQCSPPVARFAFDNTPKTSTGMSDASSPGSLTHSRVVQARLHVPLAAKGLSYTIHEEMPRRRRRNLRAAFLTPDVYGWKPAAYSAKKLERARHWESCMINKYGDPWDV